MFTELFLALAFVMQLACSVVEVISKSLSTQGQITTDVFHPRKQDKTASSLNSFNIFQEIQFSLKYVS